LNREKKRERKTKKIRRKERRRKEFKKRDQIQHKKQRRILNTLRTGDADLRFYITTVQDG